MMTISVLVVIGGIVLATVIVRALYGPEWNSAGGVFTLTGLGAILGFAGHKLWNFDE